MTRATLQDEPPPYAPGLSRLSVLQSVRHHPFMTALPIVLLVIVAIVYSLQRTPTYTAEAGMTGWAFVRPRRLAAQSGAADGSRCSWRE